MLARGAGACLAAVLATGAASGILAAEEPSDAGRAWLGVWSSDAVDGGAQILAVVRGGPAEQAGLRAGDVVLELGGRAVASETDLGRALRALAPGVEAQMSIVRGGKSLTLPVRIVARPETPAPRALAPPAAPRPPEAPAPPGEWGLERAGLAVTEIGPALREHFGAPGDVGVLVTRVEPGRPAALAGLEVGDLLVRIADRPIRTAQEVRGNLGRWNRSEPMRLDVIRAGRPAALTLTAARATAPAPETERADERRLREEIERLERRIEELRRELARTSSRGD